MRSFMVDSTVLVEHLKGNPKATELLEALIEGDVEGYINETVALEAIFVYLKLKTGRSFRTLKKKPDLIKAIQKGPVYELLSLFKFLDTNEFVFAISRRLVDEYGLLPNDAMIAGAALFYKLDGIVILDNDFSELGNGEGLCIVSSKEQLLSSL